VVSLAQQIAFQQYAVGVPFASSLDAITLGPDGALWATDPDTQRISRVTTAGDVTTFVVGSCYPSACGLFGTAPGPDGAVWFTNWSTGTIGRITTAGTVTSYPVAGAPWAIAAGPDGALWFCQQYPNAIGRITTDGVSTQYPLPEKYEVKSQPQSITAGPDGALWFTQVGHIGRITTSGVTKFYPVPVTEPENAPEGITTGPDGALWFGAGAAIGRITTKGVVTVYPLPSGYGTPVISITTGPDGALWFTEGAGADIGRITTAGAFSQYFVPFYGKAVFHGYGLIVTPGPHNDLWFSEGSGMGEIVFVTANLNVSPGGGFHDTPLTFTGSGFLPGETVNIYSAGIGSPITAKAVADSSGSITGTGLTPRGCSGTRVFLGLGQTSGKLGAPYFQMGQSLIATPGAGPPGTAVTLEGYGFSSFEALDLAFGSEDLGSLTVSLHGTFSGPTAFIFTVPMNTPPGTYTIAANPPLEYELSASTSFTVQ
jgi:virginiamycin B lyase